MSRFILTTHSRPSTFRPPTVVLMTTYGGIGNQIYFLLEALFLARHAHIQIVVPSLPFRKLNLSNQNFTELPGATAWDIRLLRAAVGPHADVLDALPDSCAASFDAVYMLSRSTVADSAPLLNISSRVRQATCFQLHDYDWGDAQPPVDEWECAKRVFAGVALERRFLPLSSPTNFSFIKEIRALRTKDVLPSGEEDASRPACVVVDGHLFNMRGKEGHEYLYSFMHFVEAVPRVRRMVSNWNVEDLAVLHLRYDEKACVGVIEANVNRVCVRVAMSGQGKSVYWAHMGEIVNVVVRAMMKEKVSSLFVAASPYVPQATLERLKEAFARRVKVATAVEGVLGHYDVNFVERELAIRAKCFIGDFGSTWSGTVYYKRRTLGKRTLWSSVLLGMGNSRTLAYYKDDDSIPRPEMLEKKLGIELD